MFSCSRLYHYECIIINAKHKIKSIIFLTWNLRGKNVKNAKVKKGQTEFLLYYATKLGQIPCQVYLLVWY